MDGIPVFVQDEQHPEGETVLMDTATVVATLRSIFGQDVQEVDREARFG